jgi:hypothetical protein
MLSALLYLQVTSLRNWLRQRLGRLRKPKYLLGAIVGGWYFWFFFFRPFNYGPAGSTFASLPAVPPEGRAVAAGLGAGVLMAWVIFFAWVLPGDKPALGFTEAEIAFLFPAPVTRRWLIHYKLLGVQLRIVLTALFFTYFSNRWRFLGGNPAIHAAGWWLILATINLHFMGAGFVLSRLADQGVDRRWRRRGLLVGVGLLVAVAALAEWPRLHSPAARDLASPTTFAHYLAPLLASGPLGWFLWPARLIVGPFVAPDAAGFFRALGPALLLLAAHYVWVLRAETPFEEASLAQAEKRGARLAAVRAGGLAALRAPTKGRRNPFRLASGGGRPEVAFWWKNLLSTRPYFNVRVFAALAAVIVFGLDWLGRQPDLQDMRGAVAVIAAAFVGCALLFGPSFARQDLRGDLGQVDILKTFPLSGWQIMLGEMLTPVSILTGVLWLALLTWAMAFPVDGDTGFTPGLRAVVVGAIAVVIPPLCALQLLVPNAATLLFPSWAQSPRQRGAGGIDMMGQRLIFVLGQLVVVVLALLPAGLVALGTVVGAGLLLGPVAAVLLAAVAVFVILAAELWLGLTWLGRRFEKLDVSADLQP